MTTEFFGPLPPSDFNRDAMRRWLDQQVVSFQKIITGSLQADNILSSSNYVPGVSGWMIDGNGNAEFNDVAVRGDIISSNWDGADPVDLSTVDTGATQGFALDSSVGSAQFMGNLFLGGDLEVIGSIFVKGPDATFSIVPSGANFFDGGIVWDDGGGNPVSIAYLASAGGMLRFGFNDTGFDFNRAGVFSIYTNNTNPGETDFIIRSDFGTDFLVTTDGAYSIFGTASRPAWSFIGDEDTGMYRSGANELSFSVGGSMRLRLAAGRVDVNGALRILDGSAANPAIRFIGDTNTGIYRHGTDATGFASGGTTRMVVANSGVHVGFGGNHSSGGSGLFVWDLLKDIGNHEVLRADRGTGTGTTEVGYFSSWEFDPHTGERRKEDIVSLVESPRWNREWFYKIRPVDFRRISTGEREFGFLLDEWKATADDMKYLTTKGDRWGSGPHETALLAATILEVQDHERRIRELEAEVAVLRGEKEKHA